MNIVLYTTMSQNTEEVAEKITEQLKGYGEKTEIYDINMDAPLELSKYSKIFIGTYTWEEGSTPIELKDYIYDVGYKPENVYVFGTGETQFGEHYCLAVDKLSKFYNSKYRGLKIEQSPRGSQEEHINRWVRGIVEVNKQAM